MTYYRTSAEISLSAIRRNVERIREKLAPGVKLCAVVKANAYGHGAVPVSLDLAGLADYFAVASPEEGCEIREGGVTQPILILGYTSPSQYGEVFDSDLTPAVYSLEQAESLSREAVRRGRAVKIHLVADTGMSRIGFQVTEEEADRMARAALLPGIEAEGLFSHMACADMADKSSALAQIALFRRMIALLEERGLKIPVKHISNSAGIMELPEAQFGMVRAGIVIYGIYPSEEVDKSHLILEPALAWKSRVIHVKDLPAGRGVSYGATFVTEAENTRIATVSVGYADGYPRALSGIGRVLIRGREAPILGRVCMDQLMVDVSRIPDAAVEDVVTLIGRDGDAFISVESVADPAARFNYEMLCDISSRVPRVYPED